MTIDTTKLRALLADIRKHEIGSEYENLGLDALLDRLDGLEAEVKSVRYCWAVDVKERDQLLDLSHRVEDELSQRNEKVDRLQYILDQALTKLQEKDTRLDKLEAVAEEARALMEVELEEHYGDTNEHMRLDEALAALEKESDE